MKILILGASGYIGTHIMLRLSQNYDKVYGTYQRVVAALHLRVPIYQTEYYVESRYQVGLPGRSEIPAELRLTVEQVLRSIWENER